MTTYVRARFSEGVLKPLEPLDLEEGVEVTVSIEEGQTASSESESILEMFDRLRGSVPPEAWDNLPTDLVKNKKHHLYGHPKEEG